MVYDIVNEEGCHCGHDVVSVGILTLLTSSSASCSFSKACSFFLGTEFFFTVLLKRVQSPVWKCNIIGMNFTLLIFLYSIMEERERIFKYFRKGEHFIISTRFLSILTDYREKFAYKKNGNRSTFLIWIKFGAHCEEHIA